MSTEPTDHEVTAIAATIIAVVYAVYSFATWHSDTITWRSLDEATRVCEPNGGIQHIHPDGIGSFTTRCKNSAEFTVAFQYKPAGAK